MTEESIRILLAEKCSVLNLHDFQLKHIVDLIEGKDLFLVLPPGAGKTLVFAGPLLWAQSQKENGIAFIIEPTKFLAERKANTFRRYGLKSWVIHEDTLHAARHDERDLIREFTEADGIRAVVMTPRMIKSTQVHKILDTLQLRQLIHWFFVDEGRLSSELDPSARRAAHQELEDMRAWLPATTVWATLTGTINVEEARTIAHGLGYQPNLYVDARYSVHRANLKYITRFLRYPYSGHEFWDLAHLIRTGIKSADEITSTLIFCPTMDLAYRIMLFLDRLIPKEVPNRGLLIKLCNNHFPPSYRNDFKDDMEAGRVRVGIFAETTKCDLDLRSIRTVISFCEVASFEKLKQQFSCAGRDGSLATVYSYAPPWVREVPADQIRTIEQKDDAERRTKQPQVIRDWFNGCESTRLPQEPRCPRQVDLEYNGESLDEIPPRCCSYHHPGPEDQEDQAVIEEHLQGRVIKKEPPPRSPVTYSTLETNFRASFTSMLRSWRLRQWRVVRPPHNDSPSYMYLPDDVIQRLVEKAHICDSFERFSLVLAQCRPWRYRDSLTEQLYEFLAEALRGFTEVLEERRRTPDETLS